ncbi:DUF4145 domain-containing protein [Vibrio salinus]|uniref:DUF4145 domain-containing protein n=1 Tax=Vibrio salinus TaxID=2899784 RepID=UPI001E585A50|nr:DUF4145 domain-containing protein [Vibrio salinus]MCE0495936.1 DUF4145 domain-containing protein [Vibrio salinus]
MDIELWRRITDYTEVNKYPVLPCPFCHKVALKLEESSLQNREISQESLLRLNKKYKNVKLAREKQDNAGQLLKKEDISWLDLIVAAGLFYSDYVSPVNGQPYLLNSYFLCSECHQHTSATGVLIRAKQGFQKDHKPTEVMKIEHFSPSIPMFPVSKNVPSTIRDELFDAFKHFHFDPPSSASKLRRAIEKFCSDMGMEGSNLNRMIQNLAKVYPEEASYLEPLKIIGNEGTHGNQVSELDLLYAFQMFEFVLELYDRKARFNDLQQVYDKLAEKFGENKLQLGYKPDVKQVAEGNR